MNHSVSRIPESRALTESEVTVVRWLLEHGNPEASQFLPQLDQAAVVSRCSCGCASIDFAISGKRPTEAAMHVLSDFQWQGSQGNLFGAFVFEQQGLLAGLDLWSIDGLATPSSLPPIEALVPYGTWQQA